MHWDAFHRDCQWIAVSIACLLALSACNPNAASSPTIAPILSPSATVPTNFTLANSRDEIIVIDTIDIPIENCNGTSPTQFAETYSKTTRTTVDLQISGSYEANFLEAAKASVALQAGISLGEEKTASRNVTLQVDARSWVTYQIVWSEIWTAGDLTLPDSTIIPFRARKGLRAELTSGKPQTCPSAVAPMVATTAPPTTVPPTSGPISATAVPVVITSPPIVVTTTPLPATTIPVPPSWTPKPVVKVNSYPCEGTIKFTTGGKLNVVKLLPQGASQNEPPVNQGSTVSIVAKQYNDQKSWYQINYDNGHSTGWILIEYVVASATCPN